MYNQQKMESIKEGAYFDYFKFFSINAAQTIRKLEATFQDQISEDAFFDANLMFKRIKTLLGSYELLILQINDSCEFVQIPEFGVCILKIFFQLMSIIRFMAKTIILKSTAEKPAATEKQKRSDQRHTMISSSAAQFYKGSMNLGMQQSKQRQNFRIKQLASHIFKDLNKEVSILQKQQKAISLQNQNTYEKISKGRQRLQQIESSQSEVVLSEAVNILFKRGEHINSFLNLIQTNMNMQSKQTSNIQNYSRLKQLMDQQAVPRLQLAKMKLNQLFKQHVVSYQKQKQLDMVSTECQVKIDEQEAVIEEKTKASFHNKKNTVAQQMKKIKNQNKMIEEENKTLKAFIHQKTQEYENAITKLRSEKINLQNKLNNQIKNYDKSKSNSLKKSLTNIELGSENVDNVSEALSHISHISFEAEIRQKFQNNQIKRSKVNLNNHKMGRSKVKFHLNQKRLQICKRIINMVANYPDQYEFNKQVYESQTLYLQIVQKNEETKSNEMKQMVKINEHPDQNEQTNRQDQEQTISDDIDRQSMQMILKNRMSCALTGLFEQKDSGKELTSSQNGLLRIKKTGKPINGYGIMKKLESKHHLELDSEIDHKQKHSNDKTKKIKRKESLLHLSHQFDSQKKVLRLNSSQSIKMHSSNFKIQKKQKQTAQPHHLIINHSHPHQIVNEKPVQKEVTANKQPTKQLQFIKVDPVKHIYTKQLFYEFYKNAEYKFVDKEVQFDLTDIINLFLSQENSHNYELLNINLGTKSNQYLTIFNNKNLQIKQVNVKQVSKNKRPSSSNKFTIGKEEQPSQISLCDIIINIIFKALKMLRQSKKQINISNYHIIKNFIRFPHSSIYKRNDGTWKQHQKENNAIQYIELKKYINRIVKLHYYCKVEQYINSNNQMRSPNQMTAASGCLQNFICDHWVIFLSKMGVCLNDSLK